MVRKKGSEGNAHSRRKTITVIPLEDGQGDEFKVWLFFEMNPQNSTATLRGVATSQKLKELWELSMKQEIRIKNKNLGLRNWWTVEESRANHLYGSEFSPLGIAFSNRSRR